MSRAGKGRDAGDNNDSGAARKASVDDSVDEDGECWWEAGKRGKQAKKVRFICKGGDEPCDKVIGGKEKSIECEACLEWYHPKCQDLCGEALNAINTYNLLWICNYCRKRLSGILDMGKRVEACIERAEKNIVRVVSENKKETAEEVEKKVQGQIKKMEEQVTKQLDTTSENLKKVVQTKDERMERSNNVIIHGLSESKKTDAGQRREEDKQKVMEIAKAVCGQDVKLNIAGAIRLRGKQGEKQEGRPSLLLVKFETKEEANKLFQERLGLRDAGFANVYINRDLSKEEREKQHKLRVELRTKGKETHRIFRGKVVPRDQ